jgi:hypothetical protein
MPDMVIEGAWQLKELGARLKVLGAEGNLAAADNLGAAGFGRGKTLRAQLLTGIRIGAKPAVEATRQAAREQLPKKGGLNNYVADTQIVSRTRVTGPRVGVRIGVNKGAPGSAAHRAYGANRGVINHPTFGHQDRRVDQTLPTAGWFDKTLEEQQPVIVSAVTAAMEAVAIETTRRLG